MTAEMRKRIGTEVLNNMSLTKEQYKEFCKLADVLDLELVEKEPEWDELDSQK